MNTKNNTLNPHQLLKTGAKISGVSLLTLAFIGLGGFTPANVSAAESTITAELKNTGYYVELSSAGAARGGLDMGEITPNGQVNSIKDTITVRTNATNGYKLYLSTKTADNKLHLTSDPTSNDANKIISPVNSTTAKSLDNNQWGFAFAQGSPYTVASYNFDSNYNSPSPTSKWAAVGGKGNESLVATTNTANSSSNHSFDIYYGVLVDAKINSGEYSNIITYTAVADSYSASALTGSFNPVSAGQGSGTTVSIKVPIYANYNLTPEEVKVTIGSEECTNLQVTNNSTTALTQNYLEISCKVPTNLAGGGNLYPLSVYAPRISGQAVTLGNFRID